MNRQQQDGHRPSAVGEDALRRMFQGLAAYDDDPLTRLGIICRACVDALEVAGSGIMLMAARTQQGTIWATDESIRSLEELQNLAVEGPCIDAYTLGRPVLVADLAVTGLRLWPQLARGALDAGMQALFSFPLHLDDTCVGALNLYRKTPEPLTSGQITDARLLAAMATREILILQAGGPPESLADLIGDLPGDRATIEQATGMAAAQLELSVPEAAQRLTAIAVAEGRHLADLAADIVTRRLRLNGVVPLTADE